MKNLLKNTTTQRKGFFAIFLFTLLAVVISCEIPEDPGSVLEIRAETNIFTHKGYILVNDLVDQNNLNGKALKAKITVLDDNRANLIVSEGGKFGNTIDINDGVGAFAVNPTYRGFTQPIKLSIEIYGNNYITKTVSTTITPDNFTTEINETMMKVTSVPDGVGVKQQTATLTSGTNTSSITASTTASSLGTSADVMIPSNNNFRDVNGNRIGSGNLSLQAVYFDGNSLDASRASINGNVGSLKDENGATLTNVVLSPLATVDIKMTVGSTEVKQFSTPIDVNLGINKDMINPNTGVKVAVGDKINVYTTSDNVNWTYLGKETIYNNNGNLFISFKTNHLSTFSAAFSVEKCINGKATLVLPDNGVGFASVYLGFFTTPEGAKIPTVGAKSGNKLILINAPNGNASLTMKPFFSTGSNVVISDIAWCGGEISNPSTANLKTQGTTVDLTISAKCPSGNSAIIPDNVRLFVDYDNNGKFKDAGLIEKGKISIPGITLGRVYKLRVTYDGNSGEGTYTFNAATMEIKDYNLPGDVCTKLNL